MWPQDDEHDVLLIDRAAAAHVPQDSDVPEWALDKRVFISSVMAELGEERAAAANGVRSLGARSVMFEEFGGRDADPLDAYLGEVETSQIYVGILGQSYGRPLPTRFSATHTEFRHAEQQGLRMAVWALATQRREGPQQSFLDEVRAFHVAPAFRSPADLERQVGERLRGIAAEDLAPWTKLGSIVFRATKVVHAGNEVTVTARVHSDDVSTRFGDRRSERLRCGRGVPLHLGRALSPCSSGEHREHHDDRAFQVDAAALEIVDGHQDNMLEVSLADMTPDDLTDVALRTALFDEPSPLVKQHMDFMAEMPDPLEPLRAQGAPDEIVRPLAEVMIIDELVGSGRAARVTQFKLGASVGGLRKLELEWEPRRRYVNERRGPRHLVAGQVRL